MTKAPEPDYVGKIRALSGRADLPREDIERQILKGWKTEWSRDNGIGMGPYRHTFTGHLIAYVSHAFPKLDMNPWLRKMLSSFEYTYYKNKRKICNFIGSQNSGKTDFFATMAIIMMSIDPERTAIYAASPYESAARSGMWGRIQKRNVDGLKTNCAGRYVQSKEKIVFRELPESGMIELRPIDRVGKLQGTKQPDPEGGWLFLFCDEIALFPTQDLKELLANLCGNTRFFCYTGCNFKSIHDLAGVLCKPEGREFSNLDPDADTRWLSSLGSVTYRFDGHRSPNIAAGKVLYKYLFKEEDRLRLEEAYGVTGPKYLEQARSFPFSDLASQFVVTVDQVKAHSGYEQVVWSGPTMRIAFCDAAFGGGDNCLFGVYEFGMGRCEDSEGKFYNRQIFRPVVGHVPIKIDTFMELTPAWADRVAKLNKGKKYLFQKVGTRVSAEQQVAVRCGELLEEFQISRSNFGFDGSMRTEFTQEMITILGNEIISLDFGGQATERPADPEGNMAKDLYNTFVAEMYFALGDLVRSGQLRDAHTVDRAIWQAAKRWWRWRGGKKGIQPKNNLGKADSNAKLKSYKDEHGESPDDADTLVGAIEIARKKGLWMDQTRTKSVSDARAAASNGGSSIQIAQQLNKLLRPQPRSLSRIL